MTSSIKSQTVRQLQDELNTNNDMKQNFINGSASDVSSDSEEDVCRIMVPKQKKGRDPNTMLLSELIIQQKLYMKSQKKVFKLQNEINVEDVRTRYLKLDLNTAQVTIEEKEEEIKILKSTLSYPHREIWMYRFFVAFGLLLYIYSTFFQSSFL